MLLGNLSYQMEQRTDEVTPDAVTMSLQEFSSVEQAGLERI